MIKKIIYIFVVIIGTINLIGCEDLRYFRHYPTHNLLSEDIVVNDFDRLGPFIDNGVLFLPRMKALSDTHPHPYSQVFLVSEVQTCAYLNNAVLKKIDGEKIYDLSLNQQVLVDRPREKSMYKSLGVKMFDTSHVDVKKLFENEAIFLEIYFSECSEKSDGRIKVIKYKLEKRESKQVAWAT